MWRGTLLSNHCIVGVTGLIAPVAASPTGSLSRKLPPHGSRSRPYRSSFLVHWALLADLDMFSQMDWHPGAGPVVATNSARSLTVNFNGKIKFQTVHLSHTQNQRMSNVIVEKLRLSRV
jgi:hypothetical protein